MPSQASAGGYPALCGQVRSALYAADAVLTDAQLGALSPASRRTAAAATRQSAALLQALSRQALANTSARFAALQQLIDAHRSARPIRRPSLDLRHASRPRAAMLQNEQTKLQVLYQGVQRRAVGRRAARARAGDRGSRPVRGALPAAPLRHGNASWASSPTFWTLAERRSSPATSATTRRGWPRRWSRRSSRSRRCTSWSGAICSSPGGSRSHSSPG